MSIIIWNWLTDWLINVHIYGSYLSCIFWTRKMFNNIHQITLLWGTTFDSHDNSLKSEAGTMKIISRFNAPPNVMSVALSKYDIYYGPRSGFPYYNLTASSGEHLLTAILRLHYALAFLCTNILYHTANTGS